MPLSSGLKKTVMKQTFYSNGKLLITGEYLVLDGAEALALPTKFGQDLIVEQAIGDTIQWKSVDKDGSIWFEDTIPFSTIANNIKSENSVKNTLVQILHEASILNPGFLTSNGWFVTTNLTFAKNWGLGTSSTLINNIAQWLEIDAYTLLRNSFGGSGYDIACAQSDVPIVYHLENGSPVVRKVNFNPAFVSNLYFVHLNKKQSSKLAIEAYYKRQYDISQTIPAIDQITSNILNAVDMASFARELDRHEDVISTLLKIPTVKESLFPDFKGTIKSLGAWGGDFVFVVCEENPTRYFGERGFTTVIPYSEMIL